MSFSVNSPSKNVILLFSSSEKVYCYCQYSAGNPYQKIDKETDGYHITDLGNHFYPRPGVDNDCDYIDNECKYKTQEINVSFTIFCALSPVMQDWQKEERMISEPSLSAPIIFKPLLTWISPSITK